MRAVTNQSKESKGKGKFERVIHSHRECSSDSRHKDNDGKSHKAKERDFDKRGHHVNHGAKERTRNPDWDAFDNLSRLSHKEQHKHGRDRKHRVKVSAHAKECDIADEDENLVAAFFVALVVPHQAEVGDEHQNEHGDAIDFSFDGVEPERVGERQEETGHEGCCAKHECTHLVRNLLSQVVRLEDRCQKFPGK